MGEKAESKGDAAAGDLERVPVRRLLPILIVVALVSAGVRALTNLRIAALPEAGGEAAWFSSDPDSLYHMRRLERALDDGGHVATRDPLLDHPTEEGAPIPWPGMYTRVLWAIASPLAPDDPEERRRTIEHVVATVPLIWGVLTSLLVALAAGRMGGRTAAWIAGLTHAVIFASVRYSLLGMGDHHAWTSLLHVAWLTAAGEGLLRREHPGPAAAWGALAGLCAGVSLASWAATLVALAVFQLTLLVLLISRGRHLRPGHAPFATAFHLVAILAVLPDVLDSPWPKEDLVNLSYAHLGILGVGFLASFIVWRVPGMRHRLMPSLILVAVGAAILLKDRFDVALAWISAVDPFMAQIRESQPLSDPVGWLGWSVLLLPFAWALCWGANAEERWPWIAAVPVLAGMALVQQRFTEGLAAPAALALGVGLARWPWARGPLVATTLTLLAVAAQQKTMVQVWARLEASPVANPIGSWWADTERMRLERDLRSACSWIRGRPEPGAVLAQWDDGHLIEWAAERPTLATNFGGYLGERWLDPWRVLTATHEHAVLGLCEARDVRFVLLDKTWRRNRIPMERMNPDLDRSLAARLVPRGNPDRPGALDDAQRLRLVYLNDSAWVYELVEGALVEVRCEPGEALRVGLTFRQGERLVEWSARSVAGVDGVARMRVPHSAAAARWTVGTRRGQLEISESAVRSGERIVLD